MTSNFYIAENPVPLEFTPVLGILIGVVITLMLVAFVIILVLRLKYKNNHGRGGAKATTGSIVTAKAMNGANGMNGKPGNRYVDPAMKAKDPDEEEYFCLQQPEPEGHESGKYNCRINDMDPDVGQSGNKSENSRFSLKHPQSLDVPFNLQLQSTLGG